MSGRNSAYLCVHLLSKEEDEGLAVDAAANKKELKKNAYVDRDDDTLYAGLKGVFFGTNYYIEYFCLRKA